MPDPTKYPALLEPIMGEEQSTYAILTAIKETLETLLGIRGTNVDDVLATMEDVFTIEARLPLVLHPGIVTETAIAASAWTNLIPFALPPGTYLPSSVADATQFVAMRLTPRAMLYDAGTNIAVPIPMELNWTAGENTISMRAQNSSGNSTTMVFSLTYARTIQ